MTIESLRMIIDKNRKVIDWCQEKTQSIVWKMYIDFDTKLSSQADYYIAVSRRIIDENDKWVELLSKEVERQESF